MESCARLTEQSAHANRRQASVQQRRAAGLGAEAQLRQGLDPGVNGIEDGGRRAHARLQAAAEQAARRAEAEQVTRDDYDHYHRGPDVNLGPSLGW